MELEICIGALVAALSPVSSESGWRRIYSPLDRSAYTLKKPYLSPDRRYSATIVIEDAAPALLVRPTGTRETTLRVPDVTGFTWIGVGGHQLLYSASGMYGKAGVWSWRGGLPKAVVRPRESANEGYFLVAIAADHSTVRVRHETGYLRSHRVRVTYRFIRLREARVD